MQQVLYFAFSRIFEVREFSSVFGNKHTQCCICIQLNSVGEQSNFVCMNEYMHRTYVVVYVFCTLYEWVIVAGIPFGNTNNEWDSYNDFSLIILNFSEL